MAQVTFPTEVGGTGITISDDGNPATGLDNGGHRIRFIPALQNIVLIALFLLGKVNEAIAAAITAIQAPGTGATSTASVTFGTGAKVFPLSQTGKSFFRGQTVVVARTSAPTTQMVGIITDFTNDVMTVQVSNSSGSGTFTDWTISLSAIAGVPVTRSVTGTGLATGGGSLAADRAINVPAAAAADLWGGTDTAKAITSKAVMDASASQPVTPAANVTLDFAAGLHFHLSAGLNTAMLLKNPVNLKSGMSGSFKIIQDGTGGRTISFENFWKFPGGVPALSTAPNAYDVLYFLVRDSGTIEGSLNKAFV